VKVGDSQREVLDEVVGEGIRSMEGLNLREGGEVRDSQRDVSSKGQIEIIAKLKEQGD